MICVPAIEIIVHTQNFDGKAEAIATINIITTIAEIQNPIYKGNKNYKPRINPFVLSVQTKYR